MRSKADILHNLHRAVNSIADIDAFSAKIMLEAAEYIEKMPDPVPAKKEKEPDEDQISIFEVEDNE